MSKRPAPTAEQLEIKRQARDLERIVARSRLGRKWEPCGRHAWSCEDCGANGMLWIEVPHVHSCPRCGCDLEWRKV